MKKWINISEKNKSFVFSPARTGSVTSYRIFQYFDFQTYSVNDDGSISLLEKCYHHHYFSFFNQHEDYSFIMTCRNPYSQVMSEIGFGVNFDIDKIVEIIERRKKIQEHFFITEEIISRRIPDYVVKVESIFEDYSNINFIRNSEFEKNGVLRKIIDGKQNATPQQYNWKQHMNQYLADYVYDINKKYFELFGYDKNSWKI